VVLPLLLASGVHARVDVPWLIDQVRAARSDVTWLLQPTLPPHTLALAVLDLLGVDAPPTTGGVRPSRRAVVGVVAGSSRQGALDGFEPLVQSLRVAGVEFVVANGPGELEPAAELALNLVGGGGVEVVPLMYADGVLVDRTRALAQQPGWRVTPPVGRPDACAEALANWLWSGVP
jgi:sirohydrochlorin ferrochelatase